LLNVTRILVSGNYVVPVGVTSLIAEVIGGGAGGRGYAGVVESGSGAGGGAGAYVRARFPVVAGQVYACVIGAAGVGGIANAIGTSGTISTMTGNGQLIQAGPGLTPASGMADNNQVQTCVGGFSSAVHSAAIGEIDAVGGEPGQTVLRAVIVGVPGNGTFSGLGNGGSTPYGRGGNYDTLNQNGLPGQGFGSGGGGGRATVGPSSNGAAGRPGIIVIWEYST
jgi:hypothetical protein